MAILHFTIPTRNVPATVQFFEATLGWKPVDRPNNIPMQAAWLSIGPDQELHLLHLDDFAVSAFEGEFGRHLAVGFPNTEFPELKQRLVENGAELIDPLRLAGVERFFFKEPNGYVFEVVSRNA